MNVVFIVPTGIGAEIGGHCGDATPAARLIASVCDTLIVHPNVVNAADINEMTENMLYVEGSILDRFLEGEIGLETVHSNKILVAVNQCIKKDIIHAISAARVTIGADIEFMEFGYPLEMHALIINGKAGGRIVHLEEAISNAEDYDWDVLVVNTPITASEDDIRDYMCKDGGTNLWGGIEAQLSKAMSSKLNRPVIHAPVETSEQAELFRSFTGITDPRKAAETLSICSLHCCLIGAHAAPKISTKPSALWRDDIDFLVTPVNVIGKPHEACLRAGIPIIAVEENRTVLNDPMPDSVIVVRNYLEACGTISAKKAGVLVSTTQRPLERTVHASTKAQMGV